MCKMAHFGNCDPETADQEYCIFHKPDKSEEEAVEFYRKFLERFRPRVEEIEIKGKKVKRLVFEKEVDCRGFVFPKINAPFPLFLSAMRDIEEIMFSDKVNFKGAIFEDDVAFINSIFKKDAIFAYAEFKGDAFFSFSRFEGDTYFDKTCFERRYSFFETKFKNVSFSMAEFHGLGQGVEGPLIFGFNRCEFSGESDFYKATFHRDVSFEGAVFKKYTLFFGAIFEKDVNFKHVKFDFTSGSKWIIPKYQNENVERRILGLGDIHDNIQNDTHGPPFVYPEEVEYEMTLGGDTEKTFRRTVFKGHTNFSYSTFRGFADFENAKFEDDVGFTQVVFEGETDFLNVVFGGKAIFNYSTFKKRTYFAWFPEWSSAPENAVFTKYCSFEGVHFDDEVSFTNVEFEGETSFYNVVFNKRAIFTKSKFLGQNTTFKNATFNNDVDFSNSKFYGVNIRFHKTKFSKESKFNNAKFNLNNKGITDFTECTFEKRAEFYRAEFKGEETSFAHSIFRDYASFDFAEFGKAFFNFATFEKGASFKNATFYDEAWFKETKFREPVEFHDSVFVGDTNFESAFFESNVEFQKTVFLQSANFRGTIFDKSVNFNRAFFNGDAIFVDSAFRSTADFSGIPPQDELTQIVQRVNYNDNVHFRFKFGGNVDFSQARVETIRFIELMQENSNNLVGLFMQLFRLPQSAFEVLRIQRLSFEKEGRRDEADRIFLLERRFRRRQRATRLRNFVEWLVGDLPSHYGTDEFRILITAICTVVLFGIAYIFSQVNWEGINFGIVYVITIIALLTGIIVSQIFDRGREGLREFIGSFVISEFILIGIYIRYLSSLDVITNATIVQSIVKNGTSLDTPVDFHGIKGALNALYYSLVTFTTLGYGDMHPTGWLKALSALEALTGAVFMALIVAVIARKWMR